MNTQDRLNQIVDFKEQLRASLLSKGYIDEETPFTDYATKLNAAVRGDKTEIDKFISQVGSYTETEFYSDTKYVRPYMFFSGGHFQSSKLATVSLPNAKVIGGYAFYGCEAITELILPEVEYVHALAFANMPALTTVILPKCKVIGQRAFSLCPKLKYVDLPSLQHITSCELAQGLENYTIPSTEDGLGAIFYGSGASNLRVWIPHTVTTLGGSSASSPLNPFYNTNSGCTIYTDAIRKTSSISDFRAPNNITKLNWTAYWNYSNSGSSNKISTMYKQTHEYFEELKIL